MSHGPRVVVLSPVGGGPFYGEVLAGLTREVGAAGGHVVLVQTHDADRPRDELSSPTSLPRLAWTDLDAVVAITRAAPRGYLERLQELGRAVVLVSDAIDGLAVPTVAPDNAGGARAAVAHLAAHGHRRIGFAANLLQSDLRERYAAYRQALAELDLESDPSWLFPTPDNTEAGGRQAADAIITAGLPVTAVLAGNDRNALGLVEGLARAGQRVPDDIAVIGFDDTEPAAFCAPGISTVSVDFDAVGVLAARIALDPVAGRVVPPIAHRPATRLVTRRSCGCQPDRAPAAASVLNEPTKVGGPLPGRADLVGADALDALADAVQVTAASGGSVPMAAVDALVAGTDASRWPPDRIDGAVAEVTARLLAAGDGVDPVVQAVAARTASQVAAALWRAKAGSYLERAARHEHVLLSQYEVSRRMFDQAGADPRHLEWMPVTEAAAGCLAVWDGDPAAGQLRIAGAHADGGPPPVEVGSSVAVERFPPADFCATADATLGQATFVIPVRLAGVDWGLLAVVGRIDTTSASTRDTHNQWATLLAMALGRAALNDSVRQSEERYSLAAEATHDGLWDWDLASGTVFYSARCREMLGDGSGAGTGDPALWFDAVHPRDLDRLQLSLLATAEGDEGTAEVEHRVLGADGLYHHVLCRAIGVPSPTGALRRLVGSLSDIDRPKQLEEQLRHGALYDDITGLPNRKLFLERLGLAIAHTRRTPDRTFAVLFLDLDGFKHVNDTLGHLAGDRLLATVGERLRIGLREVDVAARFGGDEFAVLLHDLAPGALDGVVDRLQARIAQPIDLDGSTVTVTASVGSTTSAEGYGEEDAVLRDADQAMYRAKALRRGSHVAFDSSLRPDVDLSVSY